MDETTKCGCGREGRYGRIDSEGVNIWACNKYQRCPTYDELTEQAKAMQKKKFRYEAALQKIVDVNGCDYEYKAWAKEALTIDKTL